jgi:hypothetical protein
VLGTGFAGVVVRGAADEVRVGGAGRADPAETEGAGPDGVVIACVVEGAVGIRGFEEADVAWPDVDGGEPVPRVTGDALPASVGAVVGAVLLATGAGVPVRIGSGAASDRPDVSGRAAVVGGTAAPVAVFGESVTDGGAVTFPVGVGLDVPEAAGLGVPVDVPPEADAGPATDVLTVADRAALELELGAADELGDASTPVSAAELVLSVVFTGPAALAGDLPAAATLLTRNHTSPTTAITAAAITSTRRIQYTLGSRGPTGCITNRR